MKYLIIALIVFVCLSLKPSTRQDGPCKIVQRYYLNGRLIHKSEYGEIIKDRGCIQTYNIGGKKIRADSVVTSLR